MKQAGLIRKPLVVVAQPPARPVRPRVQQWYPNAKLLVAAREDFTKERRKQLTAKIASATGMP